MPLRIVMAMGAADRGTRAYAAGEVPRAARAPGNAAVLAAVLAGAWVTLDVLLDGPLRHLDHQVSRLMLATGIRDSEWPQPEFALKFVVFALTHFGSRNTMLMLTVPALALIALLRRGIRPLARLAVLLVLLGGSVYLIKHGFGRSMPAVDGLHLASGRSYPSGHMPTAITLWGLLAWSAAELPPDRRRGRLWAVLLWGLGVLRWLAPAVVFATMALMDYHWLTDLVAGTALGVVLLRLVHEIDTRALKDWPGGGGLAGAGPGAGVGGGAGAGHRAGDGGGVG
jgi:membrane-associated phospholipid phosphatase